MLCRDEGRLYRVPAAEFDDARTCQLWLRHHNPHVRLLMTNFERFGELCGQIQALVPPGCKRTQVRVQRTARLSAAISDTMELQDTVGDEEAVLVVVDPQE